MMVTALLFLFSRNGQLLTFRETMTAIELSTAIELLRTNAMDHGKSIAFSFC